jgi:hypothetical protein
MHTDRKPFAQSCEENKGPIFDVLRPLLAHTRHLLEIGSGTGQHAVYFAARLPHLTWQTSDVAENLPGIRMWLAEAGLSNLPPPLELNVARPWPPEMAGMPTALVRNRSCIPDISHIPVGQERSPARPTGAYDAAFSANTIHIMSDTEVRALFAGLPGVLMPGASFAVYGPFNYGGCYTSDSNARFDQWLKTRDPASGIKDRDLLATLGEAKGMRIDEDHPMPCNNRILVFRRAGP